MTVMNTQISWTDSTWNWATGCTKVSDGCRHCYAEAMNERFKPTGNPSPDTPAGRALATRAKTWRPFNEVALRLDRLAEARRFTPLWDAGGQKRRPRLVFINSVSDWAHDAIPDDVLHKVFDVMEGTPETIYQCLTKRPVRARKFLVDRYKNGIPPNVWIGCSVEDNRVAARLNVIRSIKERTGGGGTFFASVEPIIGPTDAIDFEGIAWAIAGGESGPRARIMERPWLTATVNAARKGDIALWLKQHGQAGSHPNLDQAPAALGIKARFQWLIDNGWEKLGREEKGGATLDKSTYRQLPPHYHELTRTLNSGSLI